MQLTKNFNLEEFYASDTAKARKIDNTPTPEAIVNITRLVDNCMQKIRDNLGMPVTITSGFRCVKLNLAIGSASTSTSQHPKGQAADFTVKGYKVAQIVAWCRKHLIFDQLINEKDEWVHISFNIANNRREVLKFDGRTYRKI